LPAESYTDLIGVIAEERYLLASLLGKWSTSREDAARTLIKIFEDSGRAQEFLFGVIDQEVTSTCTIFLLFLPLFLLFFFRSLISSSSSSFFFFFFLSLSLFCSRS